ncbi:MAG: type III-B CRISPR module RAMP protein Cmr1 [Bradymonadaceae bacterium]
MSQHDTITATYRVNTPMFLGGADNTTSAELRLSSFKGALRFWWRALVWEQIGDVDELRRQEADLFGSSEQKVGQSKARLRLEELGITPTLIPPTVLRDGRRTIGPGARYLGYGVMEAFSSAKKGTKEGELTRPCLEAPFNFTVELYVRKATPAQRTELVRALKALGMFGGLGSKSRKGYGSLTLLELTEPDGPGYSAPTDAAQFMAASESLGISRAASPPPFSAFSNHRIVLLPGHDESALSLLDRIGRELVFFRSWGHNGRVLGQQREANFEFDHDLMKAIDSGSRNLPVKFRDAHPERVAFGLPHNYGKGKNQQVGGPEGFERRASPLFIHIHQTTDSAALGVLSFLPAQFLPEGTDLMVGGNKASINPDTRAFYKPVHDFLDRLLEGSDKDRFVGAREIQP